MRPTILWGREGLFCITVYALGLFIDQALVGIWARTLLGDKVPLGCGKGTVADNHFFCHYCLQLDHNTRTCKSARTPGWLDRYVDRDEARNNKLALARTNRRDNNNGSSSSTWQSASNSRNSSCNRGGARGGNNARSNRGRFNRHS